MYALAQNYFNKFTFLCKKDDFVNKLLEKVSGYKQPYNKTSNHQSSSDAELVTCTCCNWKGKSSATKREFLLLDEAVGLDLFCPSCGSYISFVYRKS